MNDPIRLLKRLYPFSVGLAAIFSAGVGAMAATGGEPHVGSAEFWFYSVALASLLAIAFGFWWLRRLERHLPEVESESVANESIGFNHLLAMGAIEASAYLAIIATYFTHDLMNLAFVVPFFAFAWLTWPSEGRLAWWRGLWSDRWDV